MKIIKFKKKRLFIIVFAVVFMLGMIINLPAWVLSSVMWHYSDGKLRLYNESGSFWHGSGLLVIENSRLKVSAPLVVMDWKLTLGFTKFVNVDFTIDNAPVANIYINKDGLNIDKLALSLSLDQVTQFVSFVGNLGLSGNLNISTTHVIISPNKGNGSFIAKLDGISSSMAPVNPLGSYIVNFNMTTGGIDITSQPGSVMDLSGSGNLSSLNLKALIQQDKIEQMAQFMTVMGMPSPDGSYLLKVF